MSCWLSLSRDQHGFSPLHYACIHGHGSIVDLFIQRGAKSDILNMGGDSLIHAAAQYGKYDVVMKVNREGSSCGHECVNLSFPLHRCYVPTLMSI